MADNENGIRKVSFKNVGLLRFIGQEINERGELEIDFDPDGLNSKAINEAVAQEHLISVRNRDRVDELLVLVAHKEDEIARQIEEKNHALKLLSACHKERDKYKAALLKKKRARK